MILQMLLLFLICIVNMIDYSRRKSYHCVYLYIYQIKYTNHDDDLYIYQFKHTNDDEATYR